MKTFLSAVLVVGFVLSIFDLLLYNNAQFFIVSFLTILISLLTLRLTRYIHEAIIVAHPAVLFIVTIYLYALLHSKSVVVGLGAPSESVVIAACYQLATSLAYLSYRLIGQMFSGVATSGPTAMSVSSGRIGLFRIKYWLLFVGLFFQFLFRLQIGNVAALYVLGTLVFLGLACQIAERKALYPPSPAVIVTVGGALAVSLLSNDRTAFLIFALFLLIAHTQYAKSPLHWSVLLALYFGASFMAVFSDIMLSSRATRFFGYEAFLSEVTGKLFTVDTVLASVMPFFFSHPATADWAAQFDPSNLFRSEFFEGNITLLQRLTLLPQMDVVIPGMTGDGFRMDEVRNIVLALLPDFGQEKDIILSDRISWDQGLRVAGNYGRPMITAAGEFFYIGGYAGVILFGWLSMFLLLFSYNLVRKAINNDDVFGLFFCVAIVYSTITTTSLSVFREATRTNVMLAIAIFVLNYVLLRPSAVVPHARGIRN